MTMATSLEALAVQPCVRGAARLVDGDIDAALRALPGWTRVADRIARLQSLAAGGS